MPKLPSRVNGPRRLGETDPPERDVRDEQRQGDQQDRRAQRLFGLAPVARRLQGLDGVRG